MPSRFTRVIQQATDAYKQLLAMGIPAEDARYLLPNAAETKIVVTMNARELLHFFSLRCCNRAQWEIRSVAWQMLELAYQAAPTLMEKAGPSCLCGVCPEGKKSCGKREEVKKKFETMISGGKE